MRKINKTKNTGLKVSKLLDLLLMEKEAKLLEKKIKLMRIQADLLRDASLVDSFMSLQNEDDIIIGNKIKLKNVISTRFNSTEFKKDNPKLYAKYQNQIVNSITKDLI